MFWPVALFTYSCARNKYIHTIVGVPRLLLLLYAEFWCIEDTLKSQGTCLGFHVQFTDLFPIVSAELVPYFLMEQKYLASMWALNSLKYYLLERKFCIVTDHSWFRRLCQVKEKNV